MNTIKLYTYWRSSAAYRVRIALNLKQLYYVSIPLDLAKGGGENWKQEYLDVNPQGLVPTLITEDDNVLFQSLAIIEYLEEHYPEPALLPQNRLERAYVRGLAQIIACDVHPLNNLRVLQYLEHNYSIEKPESDQWVCRWINEGLQAFQHQLFKYKKYGRFCCGNRPGLADACLVPQLYNARRFGCDLFDFALLTSIEKTCLELESFQHARPEAQADRES